MRNSPKTLRLAPGGRSAHYYYEAGHSKNESDRLGAIAKGAYLAGVARETWEDSPVTIEEVRDMMERNLPGTYMKSSEFIEFHVLPPMERPGKEEQGEIPIKGIRKLHSFSED